MLLINLGQGWISNNDYGNNGTFYLKIGALYYFGISPIEFNNEQKPYLFTIGSAGRLYRANTNLDGGVQFRELCYKI